MGLNIKHDKTFIKNPDTLIVDNVYEIMYYGYPKGYKTSSPKESTLDLWSITRVMRARVMKNFQVYKNTYNMKDIINKPKSGKFWDYCIFEKNDLYFKDLGSFDEFKMKNPEYFI